MSQRRRGSSTLSK